VRRKIIIAFGILSGVLALGIAAVWMLANPNRHREFIQAQLERQLSRKVTLGDMSLGFLPLRFQVKDPVIAEDPSLQRETAFVQAESLNIQVQLLPLLQGNVQIDSVELRRPIVEVVRTKKGTWNFDTLGPQAGAVSDSASTSGAARREFSLERFKMIDGQIGITDLQKGQARQAYDHIDLTVLHFSKGKPFALELAARVQGEELRLKCAAATIADGLVTIDNATLQLAQTSLGVAGTVNTSTNPSTMDLQIKSEDVSITEVARLASAFGIAFAPGTSVTGRLNADVRARGPVAKPQLTGKVAGRDLNLSGQGIPQPVQIKAVDLALSPTAIQSNEFTATSGKTSVLGKFSILQYASNSPSLDLGLRSPGATLPEIQSIASAYGVTGLNQVSGEGNLNFDLRARGAVQSLNTASAMKALNGTINIDFSPLKIAGFDTASQLARLAGFGETGAEQNQSDFLRIVGRVDVQDGIAQTNNLRAQLGIANLVASGTADLAAESLNLKMSSIFTKETTDKFGASRAGRFVNMALTNNAGELVLPVIVTGSFRKPSFSPDTRAIADLQKQKYLPSILGTDATGEKPSILKGIFGVLGGKKN